MFYWDVYWDVCWWFRNGLFPNQYIYIIIECLYVIYPAHFLFRIFCRLLVIRTVGSQDAAVFAWLMGMWVTPAIDWIQNKSPSNHLQIQCFVCRNQKERLKVDTPRIRNTTLMDATDGCYRSSKQLWTRSNSRGKVAVATLADGFRCFRCRPLHPRTQSKSVVQSFPPQMWNPVQKIFSTGMDKTATTCHNDKTSWSVASPSAPLELFTRGNRGFPVGGSPAEMIAGSWLGFVGKSRRPQPLNSHDSSCSTAKWPTIFGVPWTNPWTNPWASKVN